EGGELGGRTTVRVQPIYPEVRLEYDAPTPTERESAAKKRWLPGDEVPLCLVCSYPPEDKLRVRLRGEALKGGKKEYSIRANGDPTHKITLVVGPDVQDMTDHVQLEKVSGDFTVDRNGHEVPVSIGQKPTLSFPSEGW